MLSLLLTLIVGAAAACSPAADVVDRSNGVETSSNTASSPDGVGETAMEVGPTSGAPWRPTTANEALDAYWESLELPGEPPDVEVVRAVSIDEFNDIYHECMAEQGFPSTVDQFGQVGIESDLAQEDDLNRAGYVCQAQYPLDEKYYAPYTDEQLQVIYDWRVRETIPCLEQQGATVPPAPSFDVFAAEYASTGYVLWSPSTADGSIFPAGADPDTARAACPDIPPDSLLYP